MKTFTRPKIFRSTEGCCICKAKSSRYEILIKYLNVRLTTRPFTRSSRFTDSEKYEDDFAGCFQLAEERSGEICNACVLVVKRWRKLPRRKIRWAVIGGGGSRDHSPHLWLVQGPISSISSSNCFSGRYSPTYRVPEHQMKRCNNPVTSLTNKATKVGSRAFTWNNGKEVPRWGVAEIQKMSPSTTEM